MRTVGSRGFKANKRCNTHVNTKGNIKMKNQLIRWAVLAGFSVTGAALADDTFLAGFEESDTPSYVAGQQLHVAGGEPYRWNWSGSDIGVISDQPVAVLSGVQGLDATRSTTANSQLWWTRPGNAFTNLNSGVVEIQLAVKTTGWADSQDSFLEIAASDILVDNFGGNNSRSAWVTLKGNQRLYAWNGSVNEQELASGLSITGWNTIRVLINLDAGTYDVYLNDALVADDFVFYGNTVDNVGSLQFKEYNSGGSSGGVYLDDVAVLPPTTDEAIEIAAFGPAGEVSSILLNGTRVGRVYSIWSLTNLVANPQEWLETGVYLPGNGGSLSLIVTNTTGYSIYRAVSGTP